MKNGCRLTTLNKILKKGENNAKNYRNWRTGVCGLTVITMTSSHYATVFGFTQKEVLEALEEFGLADQGKPFSLLRNCQEITC